MSNHARSIIIFSFLFALLLAASRALETRDAALNARHEKAEKIVRGGAAGDFESVTAIAVSFPGAGAGVSYTRAGGEWVMPQFMGAYARKDLVEALIRDIALAAGYEADMRGRPESAFGIGPGSPVIKLYDSAGDLMADVTCGRALPGLEGGESYVRIAGRDGIFHIGGNPLARIATGSKLPPMADPLVIPAAYKGGEIARVEFEPRGAHPLMWIERRARPAANADARLAPWMRAAREYDWYAGAASGEVELDERGAAAYIGYLSRLESDRLLTGEEGGSAAMNPAGRWLVIRFESRGVEGGGEAAGESSPGAGRASSAVEKLEIRASDARGNKLVYFTGAGVASVISGRKADLLFPSLEMLAAATGATSVFDQAAGP